MSESSRTPYQHHIEVSMSILQALFPYRLTPRLIKRARFHPFASPVGQRPLFLSFLGLAVWLLAGGALEWALVVFAATAIAATVFYRIWHNPKTYSEKGAEYEERNYQVFAEILRGTEGSPDTIPLMFGSIVKGVDVYEGSLEDALGRIREFARSRDVGKTNCFDGHNEWCIHHQPGLAKWVAQN